MTSDIAPDAWLRDPRNQRQLDQDGCEVGVSRQALDETLSLLDAERAAREAAERRVRELEALVQRAYIEGFTEGMREHTSRNGGKPWLDSKAKAALAARAEGA